MSRRAAGRAPLVKIAVSVAGDDKPVRRLTRWAMKRQSALILRDHGVPGAARLSCCGYAGHGDHVTQHVQTIDGKPALGSAGCKPAGTCGRARSVRLASARRGGRVE